MQDAQVGRAREAGGGVHRGGRGFGPPLEHVVGTLDHEQVAVGVERRAQLVEPREHRGVESERCGRRGEHRAAVARPTARVLGAQWELRAQAVDLGAHRDDALHLAPERLGEVRADTDLIRDPVRRPSPCATSCPCASAPDRRR